MFFRLDVTGQMATGRPDDLPYMVEQWDDADRYVEELVALTGDYRVARAAFAEAAKHRQDRHTATEEAAARGQSPEALGSFKQRDQARPGRHRHYPESDARLRPGISLPEDAVGYIPLVVIEAEG
jgi:hypothetical protein